MKKIPVWKNLVLTGTAFATLVIATLAWFYTRPEANTDKFDVGVGEACYIQISGDNGNSWSEGVSTEFVTQRTFKEISGNGNSFFAPVYDFAEDISGGFSTQLISFNEVSGDELYFEQTYNLRANKSRYIYLSPESSVVSLDEQGSGYIDGAIRVAFFEVDKDGYETLKCIWAPNSRVEYSAETNSFTREGAVEPYYYYQKTSVAVDIDSIGDANPDVARISTSNTDEFGCGYDQTQKFMWSNGNNLPADAPAVLSIDEFDGDAHYTKTIKIKVWLEGYDRECVSKINGQKFTLNLKFIAQKGE